LLVSFVEFIVSTWTKDPQVWSLIRSLPSRSRALLRHPLQPLGCELTPLPVRSKSKNWATDIDSNVFFFSDPQSDPIVKTLRFHKTFWAKNWKKPRGTPYFDFRFVSRKFFVEFLMFNDEKGLRETKMYVYRRRLLISSNHIISESEIYILSFSLQPPGRKQTPLPVHLKSSNRATDIGSNFF